MCDVVFCQIGDKYESYKNVTFLEIYNASRIIGSIGSRMQKLWLGKYELSRDVWSKKFGGKTEKACVTPVKTGEN